MKKRFYSVVIPLFNKENDIANTLASVIKQSHPYFEILVIDDGSTDKSSSIVEKFNDRRIRLIHKENGGVSSARNLGIKHARNPRIMFLDGDDEWTPSHIEDIDRLVERFPLAGAYTTNYWFKFGDNQLKKANLAFSLANKLKDSFQFGDFFKVASRGDLPIHSSTVCIPKAILAGVGGFPEGEPMGEDQDLWARIALNYPIAFSNSRSVIYNLTANNRACNQIIPQEECPFSKRLAKQSNSNTLPSALRHQLDAYTGSHLLHIASQNIRSGNYVIGKKILKDHRTWNRPLRRTYWALRAEFNISRKGFGFS